MKTVTSLALGLAILSTSIGTHGQSLWKLPAHTDLKKATWYDSLYQYPVFLPGRMTFATGFSPPATIPMNYNMYFMAMDFIEENGDTLQINPPKELTLIRLGDHLYFYDSREGYVEVLSQGYVSLAQKVFLRTEKMVFVSGAILYSKSTMDERGAMSEYDRYYKQDTLYYFIDNKNRVRKANQPTLLKLLPGQRKAIRKYTAGHDTDYSDVDDLRQLLANFQSQKESSQ